MRYAPCMPRIRFPPRFAVDAGHVEVVNVEIDHPPEAGAEAALSLEERARAARFVFERDRARFVNTRAGLRTVLAACMGVEPASVMLCRGPRGKPALAPACASLRFNVSHSAGRALVAVALGREVGVDIELVQGGIDRLGIARSFFTRGEQATIEREPERERIAAFHRCWVAKESYLKARGDGLASPLDAFEIDASGGLRWSTLGEDPHRWRIERLDVGDGYAAALTCEDGDWSPRLWHSCTDCPR